MLITIESAWRVCQAAQSVTCHFCLSKEDTAPPPVPGALEPRGAWGGRGTHEAAPTAPPALRGATACALPSKCHACPLPAPRSQEPSQRPPRLPRPLLFPHPAAAVSPSLTLPTASDPLGGRHRCPRAGGCFCRSRAPRAPLCQLSAVSGRCGFLPRRFSRPPALCDTRVHSARPVCPAAAPGARGPASGAVCPA